MGSEKNTFLKKSDVISFDQRHRATIGFNMSKYDAAVEKGKLRYSNLELAKERASCIKSNAINRLPDLLVEFEAKITANGARVLWARDTHEAIDHISAILQENKARLVVKSKSMTTEEIEFNHHVEKLGIESLETDLGEYIVQIAGEKPYHIVTPAMHKSRKDIADLFTEKFDTPKDSSPEYLTAFVRKQLREKFSGADVGVTGANFLIASEGAIALTENEGNAFMSFSFPKIHIVIAGIEKIVPSMHDLGLLWPLLASIGTGQQITVYNSIVSGPARNTEVDGPQQMIVILLDNKRSELYQEDDLYESLKCIRCGACLNACPIYRNVGGYTYDATYSGPIGSVITPFYKGFKSYNHLSYACSVCGKCTEVCPVKIPLHKLLLFNRRDAIRKGYGTPLWNMGMKAYAYAFSKRKRLDIVGGKTKNTFALFGKQALGKHKSLPKLADQSFSQQWRTKNQ